MGVPLAQPMTGGYTPFPTSQMNGQMSMNMQPQHFAAGGAAGAMANQFGAATAPNQWPASSVNPFLVSRYAVLVSRYAANELTADATSQT